MRLATALRVLVPLLTAAVSEAILLGLIVPGGAVVLPVTPEVVKTELLELVELTTTVLLDRIPEIPELDCEEEEVIVTVVVGLATMEAIVVVSVCACRF